MTAILILPGAIFSFGQDAQDTIVNNIEEVLVTANRWEQNLSEVSLRVSRISSPLVKLQNPQTAADLLGLSGGVYIQKSQLGGGSPVIRGFAANRVLIVVDGVRMNNAIFRSGNVQNVISLDPNAIRETEVIFGPGAVMYGSDAIGGVMDFRTLQPRFSDEGKASLSANAMTRFSSANRERTAHVDFNVGLRRWSFLTSVTRSIFNDLRMGSHGPQEYTRPDYVIGLNGADVIVANPDPDLQVSTGYDQWNAMQKIRLRIDDATDLVYAFHFSETSDYPRYDRLILVEDGMPASAEWYYGPQKWRMHSLALTRQKATRLYDQIKFVAGYQDYQESRHSRGFGSFRRTDRTENVRALSANLDFEKENVRKISFFYGAEFVANKVNSSASRVNVTTGDVSAASTRYPDGSVWRSAAAYVNVRVAPSPGWNVNMSGRYTSIYTGALFANTFFAFPFSEARIHTDALSGSVGFTYNPASGVKLYSNLSTGFRAPNIDDIGKVFDSEPGNVVVPNPGLRPEAAYSAEAGFVLFSGSSLKLDLAGYYTFLNDAIARAPALFNGSDSIVYDGVYSRVQSQQNISEMRIAGLQATLEWEITDLMRMSSSFNYQKGKEGDPVTGLYFSPTHVAPMFGATHLSYRRKNVIVDVYGNYNGAIRYDDLPLSERADAHLYAKDSESRPYSPAWWTLNFKAEISIGSHAYLSGGVENLLDKRYRPYSSGISAPGRNFILSLRAGL